MFFIKKIIAAFVLPPGCLVVALGALAVYLRRRCRPAALACAALAGLTWIGSTRAFSDALLRPLENAYSTPAKPDGDVIVVLGGGARGGGEAYSASERLFPGSLERVAAAFKLHRDTGLPLLVSGGAPAPEKSEASLAALYLAELGVPSAKVILEEASRDTRENAAYCVKICGEKGYKRPILLTSAFHMPRAVFLFRRAGAEVVPFPVARRAVSGKHPLRDYLPGGGEETARALNEYLGLLYYKGYYSFRRVKKGKI